jgi:hypothetical protein
MTTATRPPGPRVQWARRRRLRGILSKRFAVVSDDRNHGLGDGRAPKIVPKMIFRCFGDRDVGVLTKCLAVCEPRRRQTSRPALAGLDRAFFLPSMAAV